MKNKDLKLKKKKKTSNFNSPLVSGKQTSTVSSQMSCGSAVVCASRALTGCISQCGSCTAERNLQMAADTKEAGYQISGGDAHRSDSTNSNMILRGLQRL